MAMPSDRGYNNRRAAIGWKTGFRPTTWICWHESNISCSRGVLAGVDRPTVSIAGIGRSMFADRKT